METGLDSCARDRLHRKALHLEYLTLSYNVLEAIAAVAFGMRAGSIALIGFGLDSVVESLSAMILIWRLRKHWKVSREQEEKAERKAVRLVSASFFLLGAYVLYECVSKLVFREVPEASLPGMVISGVSLAVMPLLAWRKRILGERLSSRALVADSRETLACAFLSLALLMGLGGNYLLGFWQADPLAGLVIAAFLFREGVQTWGEAGEAEDEGGEGPRTA